MGGGKAFTILTRKADEVDHEACIALDIKNGKELWHSAMTEAKFDRGGNAGVRDNRGGDGPLTTPAYESRYVYVMDNQLGLYCFDAAGGRTVWSADRVKEHSGRTGSSTASS